MIEGKELDVESFVSQRVDTTYPYLSLTNLNDTTPLVVGLLDDGDIPLIGEYRGTRKVIKNVSSSAYTIDKILRTHGSVTYYKSASEVFEITNVRKYLEVISGWTF